MKLQNISARKIILIGVFSVVALFAFWYLFTHSYVTFSASEEKSVYISSTDMEMEFVLNNDRRSMFLPKGDYTIQANSADEESIYSRQFAGFSKNNVALETFSQKQSGFLGKSIFNCSIPSTGSQLFYPCENFLGTIQTKSLSGLVKSRSPLFDSELSSGGIFEETTSANSVAKPYKDGLLVLTQKGKTISASVIDQKSGLEQKPLTVLEDYEDNLTNEKFATVDEINSSIFGIIDTKKKTFLRFKEISRDPAEEIDLSKEINETNQLQIIRLFMGAEISSVVIAKTAEALESHGENGDFDEQLEVAGEAAQKEQKVITIPAAMTDLNSVQLPNDQIFQKLSVSPNGGLSIFPIVSESKGLFLPPGQKLAQLGVPSNIVNATCWNDDTSFHYIDSTGRKIYRYSVEASASYLVYENVKEEIRNLNCTYGTVMFTLGGRSNVSDGSFNLFKLTEAGMNDVRLEQFLPLYYTFKADTYRIEQSQEGVIVVLDYDSNGNGPSEKDLVSNEIRKLLGEKGVNTKDLKISFDY